MTEIEKFDDVELHDFRRLQRLAFDDENGAHWLDNDLPHFRRSVRLRG